MKVWRPCLKESCDLIEPEPEWSLEKDRSFDGRPKLEDWVPAHVVTLEKGSRSGHSDFSKLSGVSGLVVNEKGYETLSVHLREAVEFLPLDYENGQSYLMNVIDVRDCLDRSRSDVSYFNDTDEIIYVRKFAFKTGTLRDAVIFRVKEVPTYGPYVTDEFIEAYQDAGLDGLDFELIWDSEIAGKENCNASAKRPLPTDAFFGYCGQIDSEIKGEIIEFSELERSHLGVSLEEDAPEAVQALTDEVQHLLDSKAVAMSDEGILHLSIRLGSMFGEALCKGYGWEWVEVGSSPDDHLYAVASPEYLYCVFPIQFIRKILVGENLGPDGENDNTIMLLYNMLDGIERNIPDKLLTPVG